jgi:hypothetical protein
VLLDGIAGPAAGIVAGVALFSAARRPCGTLVSLLLDERR